MDLRQYLERIGFYAELKPDLQTLRKLHRCHVEAIAYENLDVQFGIPVSRRPDAIFEKLVTRKRGGWCFEMNGLFAWALEEIGFNISRLAGGVHRETMGDQTLGNHLVMLVDLGTVWLTDVGFGDGLIEPVPLKPGAFQVGPLVYSLEKLDEGWWRFRNAPDNDGTSVDFNAAIHDSSLLDAACHHLQTDPQSPFMLNAVIQRWVNDEHLSLRGRVLKTASMNGTQNTTIDNSKEYVNLLKRSFGLDVPEAQSLWPQISARHDHFFKTTSPQDQ